MERKRGKETGRGIGGKETGRACNTAIRTDDPKSRPQDSTGNCRIAGPAPIYQVMKQSRRCLVSEELKLLVRRSGKVKVKSVSMLRILIPVKDQDRFITKTTRAISIFMIQPLDHSLVLRTV